MEYPINENRLPVDQFEKLGLYDQGTIYLDRMNLDALRAGRRTEMINMANLRLDGLSIRQLDAKLSLSEGNDGQIKLNIHPVYRRPVDHPLLSRQEMDLLIGGKETSIEKNAPLSTKRQKSVVIEYDEQTREFVAYYPSQVQPPTEINGETLSNKQKDDFRHGKIVELSDGTLLQHSATDSRGIRSSSARLVATLPVDGIAEKVVFRNISNIKGNNSPQQQGFSKGYNRALTEMLTSEMTVTEGELSVQEYSRQQQQYANLKGQDGRQQPRR